MSTLIAFFYGLLSAFSPTFHWLLFLRCLVGFGIGGVTQCITYYAEFLPTSTRARGIIFVELFWTFGSIFQVLLAMFVMPTLGWRHLLVYSSLPLFIFVLFCCLLPESPHYDLTCGRSATATKTLENIAQSNKSELPQGQLAMTSHPNETIKIGQLKDLVSIEWRKTTLLLWIIWFVCGFTYYGVVLLTTSLFEYGGSCYGEVAKLRNPSCRSGCKMLDTADYIAILWTTLVEIPGNISAAFLVDWLGRRRVLASLMGLFSVFTFAANFCSTRTVLTILLVMSRAMVSAGYQATIVYTPEVYATKVRAIGVGLCTSMSRIGAIISPFVAQVVVQSSPQAAISIYATATIFAMIAALFLPHETKGKPMTEIGLPGSSVKQQ